MVLSGQIYKITNVKGGTVIDLSGGDGKSSKSALFCYFRTSTKYHPSLLLVIGYPDHDGPNQRVRESSQRRRLVDTDSPHLNSGLLKKKHRGGPSNQQDRANSSD